MTKNYYSGWRRYDQLKRCGTIEFHYLSHPLDSEGSPPSTFKLESFWASIGEDIVDTLDLDAYDKMRKEVSIEN